MEIFEFKPQLPLEPITWHRVGITHISFNVKNCHKWHDYLVSKGVEKNRVYTEGKGEKSPVADNKTAEGRAKNRRVEIEVVGTRPNK
jgi:hypothetical protein